MASLIFAALVFAPSASAFADGAGMSAQELSKKVESLEKLLSEAENSILEMMEKDMGVISKLRAENRALKARVEELEEALSKSAPRKSVYDSTKRGMDKSKVENRKLSETVNDEFDALKRDSDRMYPKGAKTTEASGEKSAKDAAAKTDDSKTEKKSEEKKSVWNSIFPF